jgi:hypothetical protein
MVNYIIDFSFSSGRKNDKRYAIVFTAIIHQNDVETVHGTNHSGLETEQIEAICSFKKFRWGDSMVDRRCLLHKGTDDYTVNIYQASESWAVNDR